jgi:hypothetical protein
VSDQRGTAASAAAPSGSLVDPRGPRFGAAITTVVLAVVLVTAPSALATALIAGQTLVFALGALGGLRMAPYGWLYRVLVRPRLGPPAELEEEAPPRFAQTVGLLFGLVALVAALLGWTAVAIAAVALALVAAFLNAAFGYCLGCEMYLLLRRLSQR